MSAEVFSHVSLAALTAAATRAPRLRMHRNIHRSYGDPCQRFFNAIEPGSYIRPHRHAPGTRTETLVAVRGQFALLEFDDLGTMERVIVFGAGDLEGDGVEGVGVDVPAGAWHTVLALRAGSILLETKAGPFDPAAAKDYAPWAPEEGCPDSRQYYAGLLGRVRCHLTDMGICGLG